MRLPRVRFTVRRMMVAVALMAFLLWTVKLSAEYTRRAQSFSSWLGEPKSAETGRPRYFAKLQHYAEMERKYRRAAWFPWAPVPPDPPEPR